MSFSDRPGPYRTRSTKSEPEIDFGFDDNTLAIIGECWMIDTRSFFLPHMQWLRAFLPELNEKVRFVFRLTRANSSSKPHIRDIILLLRDTAGPEQPVEVEWHTHPYDESIAKFGEDLKRIAEKEPKLHFHFEIRRAT